MSGHSNVLDLYAKKDHCDIAMRAHRDIIQAAVVKAYINGVRFAIVVTYNSDMPPHSVHEPDYSSMTNEKVGRNLRASEFRSAVSCYNLHWQIDCI